MFGLSKEKKLTCKKDYSSVFATKNIIYGKYFSIIYKNTASQNSNQNARLGLAIAKKHHRLAVQRNKLKRIVREVFRTSTIKNLDIIVLSKPVKQNLKHIANSLLFQDLHNLIKKLQ